jgi:hypothetical protein
VDRGKVKLYEATRRYLRSKKLYYTCRYLLQLVHRCLGKWKIHYVEVVYWKTYDDEEEEEEIDDEDDGAIHIMQ